MRNIYLIFKREFGLLFTSPLAYVLFVLFLILAGVFFSAGLGTYVQYSIFIQMQQQMQQFGGAPNLPPFTDMVFGNFFRNILVIFLFLLPLLTMRMFAEERRSGTDELLMTFPIRDREIVLGKYLAALAAVMVLLALTMTYALMTDFITGSGKDFKSAVLLLPSFLVKVVTTPFTWLFGSHSLATVLNGGESGQGLFTSEHLDAGPIVAGYLGLLLAGSAFAALGIWASSLTEHQIVAANIGFAVLLVLYMVGWLQDLTDIQWLKTVLGNVSFNKHLDSFFTGDPDFLNIAYFLGLTAYFIFLTWVVQFWTRLGRGFISVGVKSKLNILWLVASLGLVVTVNIAMIQGGWSTYATVGTIFTLAAIATWFILNVEWLSQLVVSHGFIYTMLLLGLALFGLVILSSGLFIIDKGLDIIQRNSPSFERHLDLTKIQKFTLADQSKKIIATLKEPVTFVYIQDPNSPNELNRARQLFELYERQNNKMIKLEYVDAERQPGRVRDFGSTVQFGDVYVETGGEENPRRQKIDRLEENNITNGILKVVKLDSPKIYITTGHGELDSTDTRTRQGMGFLADELKKEVYEVKTLDLFSATKVPDDAAAVIVAAPKTPFADTEIGFLKNYLDKGGNLIVFLEPQSDPGMDSFLKFLDEYGVEIKNDLIVDTSLENQLFGTYTSIRSNNYGTHEITEGLNQYAASFTYARSVALKSPLPNSAQGTELVKTMANSQAWGETDLDAVSRQEAIEYNAGQDNEGPVSLGIAVSWEPEAADVVSSATDETTGIALNEQKPTSRLMVFGDADMVSNALLASNRNLMLNALAWMAHREELVSIRPKTEFGQPIFLSKLESGVVWSTCILNLPVLVMLVGITVLVRRRARG